ncbi:hypothetical protein NLJ89_g3628 [Agrocybe chaxingu]|uniref:Alpha-L-arabinofuranosidase n=1 Tax=Agrocybe chaxingu TaxID=84603 RepID=A0A9W8K4C8_9AGAR|nr:hypothetical protein NLJ89_g3628 [Agrocybe chaxingu]
MSLIMIIQQNIGHGQWVDMWVICDSSNCHLFSDGNGQLYRSQSPLADFSNGFNQPDIADIAMQDANKYRLFEAANVYQADSEGSYLLLVEAIGNDGRRYFRSWTSTNIAGPWQPLADSESNSFVRANNVAFSGTAWTKDISHGEMVRSGYDQTLKISPCKMQYLYQGMGPTANETYNALPWRLGLLTQTNSLC